MEKSTKKPSGNRRARRGKEMERRGSNEAGIRRVALALDVGGYRRRRVQPSNNVPAPSSAQVPGSGTTRNAWTPLLGVTT